MRTPAISGWADMVLVRNAGLSQARNSTFALGYFCGNFGFNRLAVEQRAEQSDNFLTTLGWTTFSMTS